MTTNLVRTPKRAGPSYTPVIGPINFDDYTAGTALISQSSPRNVWTSAVAATANRPIAYNAGGVQGIVAASTANANSRATHNSTALTRATAYYRGKFFAGTSGPQYGLVFFGAATGPQNLFYVQNVSGVDRLYWGTIGTSNPTVSSTTPLLTATGMSGTAGVTMASVGVTKSANASNAAPYELLVRATSTSTVDLYCDGNLVKSGMPCTANTTSVQGGLWLAASANTGYCAEFEEGQWAA